MSTALILAAMTVTISGGDTRTEARVLEAYRNVPECLRDHARPPELVIYRGDANALYAPAVHVLGIADRLLVDEQRLGDAARIEQLTCNPTTTLEPVLSLERMILHEIVHSFHADVTGGGRRAVVDEFVLLRWKSAYHDWAEDAERKRIHSEYRMAQHLVNEQLERGREPSRIDLLELCDRQTELAEKFGSMPSRFAGDFHAFSDPDGFEYFAIAIETLVYAPDVFCRTFSPEEIAFLKDRLHACLSQLKRRAGCYDAMPARNGSAPEASGAGMRRD